MLVTKFDFVYIVVTYHMVSFGSVVVTYNMVATPFCWYSRNIVILWLYCVTNEVHRHFR